MLGILPLINLTTVDLFQINQLLQERIAQNLSEKCYWPTLYEMIFFILLNIAVVNCQLT